MTKKITGAEYPISKIFSSDFDFIIPSYQRPYAWGKEQAEELLDDLATFYDVEEDEGYFLGSIVLIKSEGEPHSEVIDGQQRLTTLTILLAAIAFAHDGDLKDEIKSYILEPGKKIENILPKPRLALRERDQEFFHKYVQNLNLKELIELDEKSLGNEARQNIRTNAAFLLAEIEKRFPSSEDLQAFVSFLVTRCYLVAVSTPTQESAFRVFSVMNSRGMDLQPTDIIKADLIGQIKEETLREKYNQKWEAMEIELGRNGFKDLFTYIRMIYAKDKPKRTMLEEIRIHVLPKNPKATVFIDEVLEPFAEALSDIRNASFMATNHAEAVNDKITWLQRIDNSDWVPPAMLFLRRNRHKPAAVARFFQLLERVAAYMHIGRYNVNDRIHAYGRLIGEIEQNTAPDEMSELGFDKRSAREFRKILDGDMYNLKPRRRNYLMLRLDSFMTDKGAVYDPKTLTIEHVLPQTVAEGSQWEEWWPDQDERDNWVHRLGNLVPLNKKKNSAAQNFDFDKKCQTYFAGTQNVNSYAVTSKVILASDWKPKTLKARQKELLDQLMIGWELDQL